LLLDYVHINFHFLCDATYLSKQGDGGGRLYLHRGVPLDYSFQIQVRYEISKVRFFAIDDYPR